MITVVLLPSEEELNQIKHLTDLHEAGLDLFVEGGQVRSLDTQIMKEAAEAEEIATVLKRDGVEALISDDVNYSAALHDTSIRLLGRFRNR